MATGGRTRCDALFKARGLPDCELRSLMRAIGKPPLRRYAPALFARRRRLDEGAERYDGEIPEPGLEPRR